jgi:hypothetical protein
MSGNWQVEAFTGERPGCLLSSEITFLRWPTQSCHGEGNTDVEHQRRVRCQPHGVEDHTHGRKHPRGSWEIPETSLSLEMDRSEKARSHNADMHVPGKSDSLVVPEKRANNAGQPTAAESVEERRLPKENVDQFAAAPDTEPIRRFGWIGRRTVSEAWYRWAVIIQGRSRMR